MSHCEFELLLLVHSFFDHTHFFYLYDCSYTTDVLFRLCKSAPKLFDAAKKADNSGNQEESFILYMRYLNIASFVQNSDEYKRKKTDPELKLLKDSLGSALKSAEKLSKSLQER